MPFHPAHYTTNCICSVNPALQQTIFWNSHSSCCSEKQLSWSGHEKQKDLGPFLTVIVILPGHIEPNMISAKIRQQGSLTRGTREQKLHRGSACRRARGGSCPLHDYTVTGTEPPPAFSRLTCFNQMIRWTQDSPPSLWGAKQKLFFLIRKKKKPKHSSFESCNGILKSLASYF